MVRSRCGGGGRPGHGRAGGTWPAATGGPASWTSRWASQQPALPPWVAAPLQTALLRPRLLRTIQQRHAAACHLPGAALAQHQPGPLILHPPQSSTAAHQGGCPAQVGFRTWYPGADQRHIERCKLKDSATSQAALGFKVCGMQVRAARSCPGGCHGALPARGWHLGRSRVGSAVQGPIGSAAQGPHGISRGLRRCTGTASAATGAPASAGASSCPWTA